MSVQRSGRWILIILAIVAAISLIGNGPHLSARPTESPLDHGSEPHIAAGDRVALAAPADALPGAAPAATPSPPPNDDSSPAADGAMPAGYSDFKAVVKAIANDFLPEGFSPLYKVPMTAFYGFDEEMAFGRRSITAVDEEGTEPSQAEFIYIHESTGAAIVVSPMFTPARLSPDIIGFVSVPAEDPEQHPHVNAAIAPPPVHTEIFGYGHIIMTLTAFPQTPETDVTKMELIEAKKSLGMDLRRFLDTVSPLQWRQHLMSDAPGEG